MYFTKDNFLANQRIIAKYFLNALNENKVSQAILLYGETSSPLYETAMYLSQSLSCETHSLACNQCPSCKRFLDGVHPDLMILDGNKSVIKKSDIDELESFYALSNLEKNHRSVYIIHRIENITDEALNALLKFLEEPEGTVTAILTTNNRNRVLPTILSRCQELQVLSINISNLVSSYTGDISRSRYYILSNLFYSEEEKEEVDKSMEFDIAYKGAISYLEEYLKDSSYASLSLFLNFSEVVKNNKKANFSALKCYNYFYNILCIIFKDGILNKNDTPFNKFNSVLLLNKRNVIKAIYFLEDMAFKSLANMNFQLLASKLALIMEGKYE